MWHRIRKYCGCTDWATVKQSTFKRNPSPSRCLLLWRAIPQPPPNPHVTFVISIEAKRANLKKGCRQTRMSPDPASLGILCCHASCPFLVSGCKGSDQYPPRQGRTILSPFRCWAKQNRLTGSSSGGGFVWESDNRRWVRRITTSIMSQSETSPHFHSNVPPLLKYLLTVPDDVWQRENIWIAEEIPTTS